MSKVIISFNIHRLKEILLRISISVQKDHYTKLTSSRVRTTIKDYDIHLYIALRYAESLNDRVVSVNIKYALSQ